MTVLPGKVDSSFPNKSPYESPELGIAFKETVYLLLVGFVQGHLLRGQSIQILFVVAQVVDSRGYDCLLGQLGYVPLVVF